MTLLSLFHVLLNECCTVTGTSIYSVSIKNSKNLGNKHSSSSAKVTSLCTLRLPPIYVTAVLFTNSSRVWCELIKFSRNNSTAFFFVQERITATCCGLNPVVAVFLSCINLFRTEYF